MKKKGIRKKTGLWIFVVIIFFAAALLIVFSKRDQEGKNGIKTVKVTRGTIMLKALAVGSIAPRNEVAVKSKISGVVKKIFAETGERVRAGDPLIEIRPEPTPIELAETRRQVELDRIGLEDARRELDRSAKLLEQGLLSQRDFETSKREFDERNLKLKMSEERLALLESGKVKIRGAEIESVVRAPISGFILEKNVNIGDPVVPLTSYQAGTVLMTIADMDSLIFKGTVDEIDVGKLYTGMEAKIKIGALPGAEISGKLTKISLKTREENNTRVFPVEISIEKKGKETLRAGYSANAEIVVDEARDVLTIPERVVYFEGDSAFVMVPGPTEQGVRRGIEVGLSDAIMIEVISGLEEGQEVLEKPEKKL